MGDFELDANIPEATEGLRRFAAKQVPFATSLAINLTLRDAQKQVRDELPRRFTLRNTWTERGVVVRPSNKRTLRGSIGHRDEAMTLQETGGTKRPRGRALAVPTRALLKKTRRGIVPKRQRPRPVLDQKTVYRAKTRRGTEAIVRRRSRNAKPLVLYTFHRSARVRPAFAFETTVRRVVADRWQRNFGKALARAIATSR